MSVEPFDKYQVLIIFGCILIIAVVFLVGPYFEMRSFNKFSKTKATYLDAVFSELRIEPDR